MRQLFISHILTAVCAIHLRVSTLLIFFINVGPLSSTNTSSRVWRNSSRNANQSTRSQASIIKLFITDIVPQVKFIDSTVHTLYNVFFVWSGLYVIDSIVRQSRHQFGADKVSQGIYYLGFRQYFLCALFSAPKKAWSKKQCCGDGCGSFSRKEI